MMILRFQKHICVNFKDIIRDIIEKNAAKISFLPFNGECTETKVMIKGKIQCCIYDIT